MHFPHHRSRVIPSATALMTLLAFMPFLVLRSVHGNEALEALLQPPALELPAKSPEPEALLDPVKAIENDGSITLTDGSSYYTFTREGDFTSGPVGITGRTLEGRWTSPQKGRFVVTARRGWLEDTAKSGGTAKPVPATSHRIVFQIGDGTKKVIRSPRIPAMMEFTAYFLIEEFVEISAPETSEAS